MDGILDYFHDINPITGALLATLFTWGLTAAGASLVFLFRSLNRAVLDGMLGFTGGVMVAASFWSLLAPGIEMSEGEGFVKVIPAATGFLLGAAFIFGLDKVLPHVHINFKESEGIKTPWHRTTLRTLAITLHNMPEGLAVGVGFGSGNLADAIPLMLAIGIQNIPEGLAVAVSALNAKMGTFFYAGLVGIRAGLVEIPLVLLGVLAVQIARPLLPYAMGFAAGAMLYVISDEIIPETHGSGHERLATLGTMLGVLLMLYLDVSLG
jgi:ZIP family zinc transporter